MKLSYPLLLIFSASFLLNGCVPFWASGNKNWKLATAAATADTAVFEKRLNEVQDINARPTISSLNQSGASTILMIAAYGSDNPRESEDTRLILIRQLLKNGANPFLKDAEGRTAADYARLSASFKIESYLRSYTVKMANPPGNVRRP